MIQADISSEDLDSVVALCHSLQLATLSLSLDMHITHVNPIMASVLSQPKQQLINKPFHFVCCELGIEAPISSLATPETLNQFSTSTTHWVSNKKIIDVHWTISRIMNAAVYVGYFLIGKVTVGYSPNKQPLAQMEHLLRALPVALFSKDQTGHYIVVNDYQAHIAGCSHVNDMIGRTDTELSWASDADKVRQADMVAVEKKSTILIEEQLILGDGKRAALLVTKSPLLDKQGDVVGVMGSAIDVTKQQQMLFPHNKALDQLSIINNDASKNYLSKKEIECVNWMIKGKSSHEIALILNISKRTVEAHMNSIKKKLNCYKQFQVGYIIGKYGYLLL